jgi:hypothetical protein
MANFLLLQNRLTVIKINVTIILYPLPFMVWYEHLHDALYNEIIVLGEN